MPKRIAIVEDDRDVADLIEHYVRKNGHDSVMYDNGEAALAKIRSNPPDLLILDLMLPGIDGLELCRMLRADPATKWLPIIMLTAKGEETDRIVGLEMGADDYVIKPFSPNELMARVKAILRRSQKAGPVSKVIRYGQLLLDDERHIVTIGKTEIELSAKEFGLLTYLLQRPGRVHSRDQILAAVWGHDYNGESRTVDVHIRHLRAKIPMLTKAIVTVKSFGYKLQERP
ncbi:MAG: response regulator transcription factor [Candidatus Edwardsbacteria bacterium]|jgi:DNA-binding response OmpR family regulator|nr:response regulator transcription factor [Candidatus Edwardsbacteria bacterium]